MDCIIWSVPLVMYHRVMMTIITVTFAFSLNMLHPELGRQIMFVLKILCTVLIMV